MTNPAFRLSLVTIVFSVQGFTAFACWSFQFDNVWIFVASLPFAAVAAMALGYAEHEYESARKGKENQ